MTKSNQIKGSIFWVRDKKTKITVFRKDDEMKVRKGNEMAEEDITVDPKSEKFVDGLRASMDRSRTASICSVCNSSISIHQNERACKGESK